jgi:hypothetical protein
MFGGAKSVYAMVTGFKVRVKDEREQDRNHIVEVTFELPLSFDLADEILPAMAGDLFVRQRGMGAWAPREEIQEAVFNICPEPQLLIVRTHPDMDPELRVGGVTIRRVQAYKAEAGTWLLGFTAGWTLGDSKEAVSMIRWLKVGVYLEMQLQEPALPLQSDHGPVDGQVIDQPVDPKPGDKASRAKRVGGKRRKALPAAPAHLPAASGTADGQ